MGLLTTSACRYHRRALGLTQSALAKAAGSSASYVKMFESERLKPSKDFLNKLSTYFATQGIPAEQLAADYALSPEISGVGTNRPGEALLSDLDKRDDLARALLCVRHFALSPSLSCDQITAALERMDANDRKIRALLAKPVESGFLNTWGERTENDLQEVFGLMAENHVLFTHLQGRSLIGLDTLDGTPPTSQAKDIAGIVAGLLAGSLGDVASGLAPRDTTGEEAQDDQENHDEGEAE